MNIPTWFLSRVQSVWTLLRSADAPHEVWLLSSGSFVCTARVRRRMEAKLVGVYTKTIHDKAVYPLGFADLCDAMWMVWCEMRHKAAA
jgi:hypothetical protein